MNADGSKVRALYVKDIHGRKTELVEGVSNMEISYSIAENNFLKNVSQNEMGDGSKVQGVAIMFELISLNAFKIKKKAYVYTALRTI
jgi:hypothetical protein